jgi:hypothetical protein
VTVTVSKVRKGDVRGGMVCTDSEYGQTVNNMGSTDSSSKYCTVSEGRVRDNREWIQGNHTEVG